MEHAASFLLWREDKGSKLCLLSVKILNGFSGRCKTCCFTRGKRNVLLYKCKNSKALQKESMQHVSLSGERGWTASLWLVGESRMLYVGTEERMLLYEIFLLYMKKPYAVSTPCAPQGAHRPGLLTLSHRHMSL